MQGNVWHCDANVSEYVFANVHVNVKVMYSVLHSDVVFQASNMPFVAFSPRFSITLIT